MADRETNVANWFETTLSGTVGPTDLTFPVLTTVGGPASPCFIIINPDAPAAREVILCDGAFTGTSFVASVLANRYLAGSAAASGLTHDAGTVVRVGPLAQHIEDLNDRISALSAAITAAGYFDATAVLGDLADVDATIPNNDDVLTWDGDSWVPAAAAPPAAAGATVVRKAAAESVVSSATRQNDDELLFAVGASESWVFEMLLVMDGVTGGDFSMAFTAPAGASGAYGTIGLGTPVTSIADPPRVQYASLTSGSTDHGTIAFGTQSVVFVRGTVVTAAAAGNVQLQWAQHTSNATATRLLAGSYLVARKVA